MKRDELIKKLSHEQLLQALFQSQLLFFIISICVSFLFFDHIFDWFHLFTLDLKEVLLYGVIPGFIIVLFNLTLKFIIPEKYLDDGGLNEKLFKNSSIGQIFLIAVIVSISEELLFRGLIQTVFGYFIASTTFAIVHVRYLKKPVLLISIILVSFYLGYLYLVTENLLVTICAHFIVDFILGLFIRYEK